MVNDVDLQEVDTSTIIQDMINHTVYLQQYIDLLVDRSDISSQDHAEIHELVWSLWDKLNRII